jgi:hypothetical protein
MEEYFLILDCTALVFMRAIDHQWIMNNLAIGRTFSRTKISSRPSYKDRNKYYSVNANSSGRRAMVSGAMHHRSFSS